MGIYTEIFKRMREDEFVIYEPSDCSISRWFNDFENVSYRQTGLSSQSRFQKALRGLRYWAKTLKDERLDIFEGFHLPAVKSPSGQTLLTIHDIRPLMEDRGWKERTLYINALKRSLELSDHVITVSQSMRTQFLEHYPDAEISVIYNGIDIEPYNSITHQDLCLAREKFDLPEEFLLAVGHFEKRKNYIRLIEALARLHERGRKAYLVGNDSNDLITVKQKIDVLGLSGHVTIFSGLTDHMVRCIYKLCTLFVFPSAYEGFGIPILEAMAAERPMVISDIPVFQEITQGQSTYFDQDNPESISNAIDEVLMSTEERERLVQYGNERVHDFNFKNLAIDLEKLYKSL